MFCDDCDRGYHTFCLGLHALPKGKGDHMPLEFLFVPKVVGFAKTVASVHLAALQSLAHQDPPGVMRC